MTGTSTAAEAGQVQDRLLAPFESPWRDDTPVFACCRRAVAIAVETTDITNVATLDPAARVRALRDAVEVTLPGHLDAHRCCVGHLADLAFDLPELLAPAAQ